MFHILHLEKSTKISQIRSGDASISIQASIVRESMMLKYLPHPYNVNRSSLLPELP